MNFQGLTLMPDAIYNTQDILIITPEIITDLKKEALKSRRKRYRLCLHYNNEHPTHEMLIVFHKDTYMPPHRHPIGKSESYHIVEGTMTVYFFDDDGTVIQHSRLSDVRSKAPFMYRLSGNIWHMPVAESEWLVYHETYTGPFDKMSDVEFTSWAPREDEIEKSVEFLKNCRNSTTDNKR